MCVYICISLRVCGYTFTHTHTRIHGESPGRCVQHAGLQHRNKCVQTPYGKKEISRLIERERKCKRQRLGALRYDYFF